MPTLQGTKGFFPETDREKNEVFFTGAAKNYLTSEKAFRGFHP